jgi:NAD(P)-dependent dehydrogenase (short-subunit alcohol dehydrogenase family)
MNPNARHVLVTGASRGLGRDMAQALAADGFTVFAGVRSHADFARMAATSPGIVPLQLDVTDDEQVSEAVRAVSARTDKLDALVNNAGIFIPGPLEHVAITELVETFRVNVFGVVAVTQAFLPLVRSAHGRILLISSVNGRLSAPGVSAYSASKSALTALADAMRLELEPWGIRTILVEPGALATDIRVRGFDRWEARQRALPTGRRELYAPLLARWKTMLDGMEATAASPDYAVSAVREALTSPSPKTRYVAAPNAEQLLALIALPDEERDRALASMFGQP